MSLVVKTTPVRIYGLGQPIYEPTESDISKDSEKSECPQSDMEKKCLKESEWMLDFSSTNARRICHPGFHASSNGKFIIIYLNCTIKLKNVIFE